MNLDAIKVEVKCKKVRLWTCFLAYYGYCKLFRREFRDDVQQWIINRCVYVK
jgi:hypothetical protein